MKNIFTAILILTIFSCNSNHKESVKNSSSIAETITFYGKEISNDSILDFVNEKQIVKNQGLKLCKLKGKIVETCSKKGCWMTLDTGEDTLFIKFRDYGFFVPIDSDEGKDAIVQ